MFSQFVAVVGRQTNFGGIKIVKIRFRCYLKKEKKKKILPPSQGGGGKGLSDTKKKKFFAASLWWGSESAKLKLF